MGAPAVCRNARSGVSLSACSRDEAPDGNGRSDPVVPSLIVPDDREAEFVRQADHCTRWNVIPLALYLHPILVAFNVVFNCFGFPAVGGRAATLLHFFPTRVGPSLYIGGRWAELPVVRRRGETGGR